MIIDAVTPAAVFDAHAFFNWFITDANLWFVFVFMIIESSFVPFPSEVVIPPAAYLAATRGNMNVFAIVLAATAGAVVGALINYVLAMLIGRPVVYAFARSRIGHACLVTPAKIKKAEDYFDRHGAVSTFVGRLIPAVRQLISIPAGLARLSLVKFVLYTALGAGLWNAILAAMGYWLGTQVPLRQLEAAIEKYNGYLTYAGLVLLLACALYIAWRAMTAKRAKSDNR